jgi:hypothetical protein
MFDTFRVPRPAAAVAGVLLATLVMYTNAVSPSARPADDAQLSGGLEPPIKGLETADIVRFLEQSTWGPTPKLIEHEGPDDACALARIVPTLSGSVDL